MTYVKQHKNAITLAWRRIKQAPLINIMSLLLMVAALTLPSFLLVLTQNLQDVFSEWQTGTQMTIYLQQTTPQKNIDDLLVHLNNQINIKSVKYISPTEGLKEFSQQFQLNVIDDFKENPLPPVIVIQPRIATSASANQLAEHLRQYPLVNNVQFDQQWVKRLFGMIQVGQRFGIILAVLLGIAIVLIVGNAVYTATQRYVKEIHINQIVGATNGFIRRPFLYAGAFLGMSAGVLTLVCVSLLIRWLNPKVTSLAGLYGKQLHLHSLMMPDIVVLLLLSTGLSWLGATLASNRLIRNT